jgi:hypothetical protein
MFFVDKVEELAVKKCTVHAGCVAFDLAIGIIGSIVLRKEGLQVLQRITGMASMI